MVTTITLIPHSDIIPYPNNPRRIVGKPDDIKDLADSIRKNGLIQPINVRPHPTKDGKYQLLAGERRWRASRLAGLNAIDAIVRDVDDVEAHYIVITENLQREDLHWLEEASGIKHMLDAGLDEAAVAERLNRSVGWVATRKALTELDDGIHHAIMDEQSIFSLLPLVRIEAIARMPKTIQAELLKTQPGRLAE